MNNYQNNKIVSYLKNIPRVWKGILIGLLVLILIIGGLAWYLSYHWKPILTKQIKKAVVTSTDSLYKIDFESISLNVVTGHAGFEDVVFKPDSLLYQKLKKTVGAPKHLYRIELKTLIFNGIHPLKIYFNKSLKMESVVIDKPVITVWFDNVKNKADTLEKDTRTAYQRISKFLKVLNIDKIVVNDASVKYIDRSVKDNQTTEVKNINVKVTELLIDSASQNDKKFYHTKDVFMQIKDYEDITDDGMYTISAKEVTASTEEGYARLSGFKLAPRYAELEFSRKYKVQKDRYSLSFRDILLNKLDFNALDTAGRLIASSLLISGGDASIFLNRELPPPPIDKAKNFPHIALQRASLKLLVDTVKIEKTNISYTEYNPQSRRKGTIFFSALGGTIKNVTNDSLALIKKNHANANLSTLLMGKARLNVAIDFNLTDANGAFSYHGSLGAFDMRILNKLARSLGLVEIESGHVRKAVFNVQANAQGSTGNIDFYYNNLKANLLKQNDEGPRLQEKGVLSLLANTILIKNDNPSGDEPFRKGPISFERPESASFFNLMWKSVFSGLKETVGLGILPQKAPEKPSRKQQREQRREERQEKREERHSEN